MRIHSSTVLVIAAVIGLHAWGQPALALEPEVRDQANFFMPATVTKANEQIREIKHKYRKDLLIETVSQVPEGKEHEATSQDPRVKDRFFNQWARQRAHDAGVNGIYVLITRKPGHVQVEVGNQTRKIFSLEEGDHLSRLLVDRFKKKDFDEGLLEAIRFVRSALQEKGTAAVGPAAGHEGDSWNLGHHQPAALGDHPSVPGSWGLGGWLCIGLAVILVIWVVIALLRAVSGGMGGGSAPGGGGFFSSLLGGMFGAAAGMWLYNSFFGGHSSANAADFGSSTGPPDTDFSGTGGDFDSGSGGDFDSGGGGDFGGGDFGGGDFGGGGDF